MKKFRDFLKTSWHSKKYKFGKLGKKTPERFGLQDPKNVPPGEIPSPKVVAQNGRRFANLIKQDGKLPADPIRKVQDKAKNFSSLIKQND